MYKTNISFSLLEKIERANKKFSLFDGCEKILVGLSGGADSTSLVLSLKELSSKYGFSVYALHVNHMIRGQEAERDENFAKELCQKLDIGFFCERVDVPALSKERGESLELCARNERYKAFEKICRENGITCVATAHNACDNAETVLFNLTRGSGIRGLCGIPPKRDLCDGISIIRPLILAERKEIEDYLEKAGQCYVTDSTNSDTDYTRNFIRREIFPLLRKINPVIEESIAKTSEILRNDEDYISIAVENNLTNDVNSLSKLHKSVLSRVVIRLFSKECDETPSEIHVNELCDKIYSYDGKSTSVAFPGSMSARLCDGRLSFVRDERKKSCDKVEFCEKLADGPMFFEDYPFSLYITFDQNKDIPQTLKNGEIIYKKVTTDYLYFDTIPHVLFVRNRHDGDKISSCGMTKSIKRLMKDSPYSEDERYFVPFVCTTGEILCVPGVCVSELCKKNAEKTCVICVSVYNRI